MPLFAWIVAVLGAALAWVISLAGSMSTVPRLSLGAALAAVPLPLLAMLLGALHLTRRRRAEGGVPARALVAGGGPVALGALTLLYMFASYWYQPGGTQ